MIRLLVTLLIKSIKFWVDLASGLGVQDLNSPGTSSSPLLWEEFSLVWLEEVAKTVGEV